MVFMHLSHYSANSVPTSNLVCIKEVAIGTTFSHMINIAGIIHYTCSLVIDIQCTCSKKPSTNLFNGFCVKITAKIYCGKNSNRAMHCTSVHQLL